MNNKEELKACPFCGEKDLLEVETIDFGKEKRPFGYTWTARVDCLNCSGSCGTHGFEKTEEDARRVAIKSWNRRRI